MKRVKLIGMLGLSALAIVIAFSGGLTVAKAESLGLAAQQQVQPVAPATPQDQTTVIGQRMMDMGQQMMAEQQASLARLQQLMEKMSAAKGDAKVDAIAAVVTELVQQQKAAQERMMMPMMMIPMMGTMPGMTGTAPPAKKP